MMATTEASPWFSRSSSPLSTADELHERSASISVEEDQLSIGQLEGGRVDEEKEITECFIEYPDNEEEEGLDEDDGEEFTVMGRHGALISLIWGATALYVLLIRAKVQLFLHHQIGGDFARLLLPRVVRCVKNSKFRLICLLLSSSSSFLSFSVSFQSLLSRCSSTSSSLAGIRIAR